MDDDYRLDARVDLKAKSAADGWAEFEGIASTDSQDLGGDVVEARAFEPIDVPHVAMLLHHDMNSPVGIWKELRQEGRKLIASGKIRLTLSKGKEAYELIREKIVTGLSIGFKTTPGGVTFDENGNRRVKRGQLFEVSLVAIPMQPQARITVVRSFVPTDLAAQLDRLDASWRQDTVGQHRRLIDIESRLVDGIVAAAKSGQIDEARAMTLLTELRAEMRT